MKVIRLANVVLTLLCSTLLSSVVSASHSHAAVGLDALRGGSAVRKPSLVEQKKKLAQQATSVRKQVNVGQQKAKRQVAAVTASPKTLDALAGVLVLTAVERAINKLFVAKSIKFPAQLAGCIALFFGLLTADIIRPGLGESIYNSLLPGSNLLAKWFPVLFVPGLVLLPLAPSIGNGMEVRTAGCLKLIMAP